MLKNVSTIKEMLEFAIIQECNIAKSSCKYTLLKNLT